MGILLWFRRLLGKFWTRLFGERDFILWVENLMELLFQSLRSECDMAIAERALSVHGKYRDRLPYPILFKLRTLKTNTDNVEVVEEIGGPANTLLSVLRGADPAGTNPRRGWLLKSRYAVPAPCMITDHVLDAKYTMFAGLDFSVIDERTILMYTDPGDIGWTETAMPDADGNMVYYYKVFGWAPPSEAMEDNVAAFESPLLCRYADIVWDIHQNGATELLARRLLGAACGSVVCTRAGVITDMWDEEGGALHCLTVADVLYSSRETPAPGIHAGVEVPAGAVLFGGARFYSGEFDAQYEDVPGIYVMTDAGEMFAANIDDMQALVLDDGQRLLPLAASASVESAYAERCAKCAGLSAPYVAVPDALNPCAFILNKVRGGCYLLLLSSVHDVRLIAAALSCIRASAVASGMTRVYLKVDTEPITASASASATALRTAIATTLSAGVKDMSATARVFI